MVLSNQSSRHMSPNYVTFGDDVCFSFETVKLKGHASMASKEAFNRNLFISLYDIFMTLCSALLRGILHAAVQ